MCKYHKTVPIVKTTNLFYLPFFRTQIYGTITIVTLEITINAQFIEIRLIGA